MKRLAIARRGVLAGVGGLLAAPAIVRAQGAAGVALVIGNSKYQWEAQLPNVRRDAPDIAKRFQAMGLKTELVQDAGRDAMKRAIDSFTASAQGARLATLYFAGHGATWNKETYLVPVDADLSSPSVAQTLVPAHPLASGMMAAAGRLMVFDNCRNNPADGWRQREVDENASFRPGDNENLPANTLILYSTAPGRIALDGPAGGNSPFAASLLRQLDGASVDLQAMPAKLRRDLLIATQGRQVLWDSNTFPAGYSVTGARGRVTGATGGWAADPSMIVEVTNAYGFAAQNNLPLPAGLIAHRSGNARDDQKIGAFRYDSVGGQPGLLVVMSVDGATAEMIMATRNPRFGTRFWRFVRGTVSGDQLEFLPKEEGAPHLSFRWSSAAGGNVTMLLHRGGPQGQAASHGKFSRLDG